MWLTWANLLSLVRLVAAPLTAWAIVVAAWPVACALFTVAVVTDLLDGPVARAQQADSALGGKIDHGTDAFYVVVALVGLAALDRISLVLPFLIAAAFLQYAIDSGAHKDRPLRASQLGRWNGIAYYVLVGIPVVDAGLGLHWIPHSWVAAFSWVLIATTLVSMVDRALARFR